MIFATGIAFLTSEYPLQERGRVLGIAVAAVYIGLSCGPFFGGWLTQHFSLISSVKITFIIFACPCLIGNFFSLYRGNLRSR